MTSSLCTGSAKRQGLAISLCFSLAVLMGLEALHPGGCQWMGLDPEQSFALSTFIATISTFFGTFIATRRSDNSIKSEIV